MKKPQNAAELSLSIRLAQLPKERLVAFIEELAATDGRVLPQIDSLLSEGDLPAAVALTRRRLAALRRSKKHYWGARGASEFAADLEQILGGIERAILPGDPALALELVAHFIGHDKDVYERADDSTGRLGDVFRQACTLFGVVAQRCASSLVQPLLRRLWYDDGYGARGTLVRAAAPALDDATRAQVIAEFRREMQGADQGTAQQAGFGLVEMADALGDPDLYAEARLHGSSAEVPVYRVEVARRYLRAGRAAEALAVMPANASACGGYASDWVEVYREILRALGRTDQLREVLWGEFRSAPSKIRLEAWLAAAPPAEHEKMTQQAREGVAAERYSAVEQARFFMEIGDEDESARCILSRWSQLNGDYYDLLVPLAKGLASRQPLAASALYRALLEGNLRKGLSKYYPHGVRYWRALSELAPRISEWSPLSPHTEYVIEARKRHVLKTAFWRKVDAPD